jgi:CRISPR-associated endonuclease/helicase Cas3
LYENLERVKFFLPDTESTIMEWKDLASELSGIDQALCIVSDRKSCRELYAQMPKGSYHLSALMCPQHRSDAIAEIKDKLGQGEVTRVISTQLVEAGVDIDFPVVYRSMAGVDSIIQAAGRCNREGKLNGEGKIGRVVVFNGPRRPPAGLLRKAAETTQGMCKKGLNNPMDHRVVASYFTELFWKANSLDVNNVTKLLTPDPNLGMQFRSAAAIFKIIDDKNQRTILVPYKEGSALIEILGKNNGLERILLRKLQRYTINIYSNQFNELQRRGSLKEILPGIFALNSTVEYDQRIGLLIDEMPNDPEAFMCS